MNATVDAWLTRFAAGAGSQYVWHLIGATSNRDGRGESRLRAFLSDKLEVCPLSAQATYESGQVFPVQQWRIASAFQGMSDAWNGGVIALAADDDAEADPDVRARLLRICGLTPPPQRRLSG